MYLVAVMLLLKELSRSAFTLGLFQFLALSPAFFLSPVSGAIIDATSRRRVVVLSDLLRGVLMIAAGIALMVFPVRSFPSVPLILVVSLASGVGHAFFVPAAQALLPALVPAERLQAANGLRAITSQGANLVGNAVGGLFFALIGAPALFVANGVTFVFSALQERRISQGDDRTEREDRRGRVHRTNATLETHPHRFSPRRWKACVRCAEPLRFGFWSFPKQDFWRCRPCFSLPSPFLVIDQAGLPAAAVGLYYAAALCGGVLVFLRLRLIPATRMLRMPLPSVAYLSLAAAFAAVALSTGAIVLAGVAVLSGAAAAMVYLYTVTWIQSEVQATLHGRIFALLEAAGALVAPLSYVLSGALLDLLGPERWWVLFASSAAAALAWGGFLTAFRRSRAVGRSIAGPGW